MNLRFILALVLVVGTIVTGIIWLVDKFVFAPKRRADFEEKGGQTTTARDKKGKQDKKGRKANSGPPVPVVVDYAKSFFPVFVIVLVVRSFIVEPFSIPTGSMIPTLHIGDYVLVNKFSYSVHLPLTHWRVIETGKPSRGDVVVFRPPWKPDQTWIKRIVGLPGDHIVYRNETLYINGKRIKQTPMGWFSGPHVPEARISIEHLNGHDHRILIIPNRRSKEGSWTVPPHEYFVMGDNRDNSEDSRYKGAVPASALVGKAFIIWMNWKGFPSFPQWNRIGTGIQ